MDCGGFLIRAKGNGLDVNNYLVVVLDKEASASFLMC